MLTRIYAQRQRHQHTPSNSGSSNGAWEEQRGSGGKRLNHLWLSACSLCTSGLNQRNELSAVRTEAADSYTALRTAASAGVISKSWNALGTDHGMVRLLVQVSISAAPFVFFADLQFLFLLFGARARVLHALA